MTKIALVGKYPPGTLEAFQAQLAGEDVQFALVNTPEAYEKLDDADCMVLRVFKAPRDVIERNAKLKLLCRWGVGYDTVDIACAGEKGVMVTNTPGANAYSVSELAVLLMLAVGRNLMFHNKSIQSGVWSRTLFTDNAVTLNAKKVGIVGGGNIGRQVARKVQAFGAQVQYYDVFRLKPEMEREFAMTYVSLEELVRTSDVISLHVPLTEDNHHMLDASMIAKMKKNAILVNTARGGLIDTHQSSCCIAPTLAYCDSYYDGENIQGALIRSITEGRGLTSFLSLPAFRTEYMGKNLGLIDQFIAYTNPEIGWTIEKLCALTLIHDVIPRPRQSGAPTVESMAVDLDYIEQIWRAFDEYGVEDAAWLPYWEQNDVAACETKDAYLSLYRGARVLGVLSNLATQSQTVRVRTDKPSVENVLTGEVYAAKDGRIEFVAESYKPYLLAL